MKRNTKQKKEAPKNGLLILVLFALYKWLQKAWAQWMSNKTKSISKRAVTIALVIFVSLTSGYCIYLGVHAITGKSKDNAFTVTSIKRPSGRKLYDSIVATRPGLMDSVRYIEKEYQNFKNQ
ncbi:hypothetical protein [Zunongwangia profunda]|jgi:hypothetical protein|uniref:hypothetical protein n=1 Tax=Zunongwangia profunda TaxID=398743 RepID=UPI001D1801D8|nr:hypothetical protein [Zunongwangia profunda]MCC4229105.1 hypothetical protein [Zunongwangia profunda]